MDGLSAAPQLRELLPDVPIIIITAYGDLDTAVGAMRAGAFEYLIKPFDLASAERAIERALKTTQDARVTETDEQTLTEGLVGSTPGMQQVFKRIALAASSEACVQIQGESGTGKELVARAIHRFSARAAGPFVAVNIASLNESVAESELFGHVRGAFTGAEQSRLGLLEQAHGGTLFLDEIAEIPLTLQVKLLRALELGEFVPVGANQPRRSDFRVLSASHQDLARCVGEGSFRHDLFFRLNTFEIVLPPLRERVPDIKLLAEHFISDMSRKASQQRPQLTSEALAELERRPWNGNVRELRNVIEHAMIVSRGGWIGVEHLPLASPTIVGRASESITAAIRDWARQQFDTDSTPDELYQRMLEVVEPPLLEVALERHGGQQAAAAKSLGLHRMTLRKKIRQIHGKHADASDQP
jgi:two-component system nitrogen regulation response regulator GlnG